MYDDVGIVDGLLSNVRLVRLMDPASTASENVSANISVLRSIEKKFSTGGSVSETMVPSAVNMVVVVMSLLESSVTEPVARDKNVSAELVPSDSSAFTPSWSSGPRRMTTTLSVMLTIVLFIRV